MWTKMQKFIPTIAALFLAALLWEVVRVVSSMPPVILPPLYEIVEILLTNGRLYYHGAVTAVEAMAGFVLGNVAALIVAVLLVRDPKLEKAILPYAIALKTTPVVAIAPVFLIWFGSGISSKAIAAAVVCFFPMLINAVRGLRAIEREYLDLFSTWKASWLQTLKFLRLPSSLPYLFAALKVSSSLAIVGAIVAEFIAADKGLGFLIVIFSRRLDTADLFATIIISTLLGVVWFYGIVLVERRIGKRFRFLARESEFL